MSIINLKMSQQIEERHGNQGASKFKEFIHQLEKGLKGGLPPTIKQALKAIKSLDQQKDC
jgi:hypothetical protein